MGVTNPLVTSNPKSGQLIQPWLAGFSFQMNRDMDAGWIVVARIRLQSANGYVESSPFAVAIKDQDSAINVVRTAFPLKEGVEFTATEPLSARDLEILELREGEFRARWKTRNGRQALG